ncbi:hypothetical protein CN469_30485 [Bacillus cereus]|nr:hypothetical protein CN469_30485 [Bacillus cereus]
MVRVTFLFRILFDFFAILLFRGNGQRIIYIYCIGEERKEATLIEFFWVFIFKNIMVREIIFL